MNLIFDNFNALDLFILLYYFIFASLLIVAFVYDFKHKLIPDFTSYGIFALFFVKLFVVISFRVWEIGIWGLIGNWKLEIGNYFYDILMALGVALVFGGIWYFSAERAMGFGDVKLAPAITLFLGFSNGILAILLSFWLGSIIGLFLILYSKARPFMNRSLVLADLGRGFSLKSEIPFGPFLVLGALIALLWGERIISLYFQFLLY